MTGVWCSVQQDRLESITRTMTTTIQHRGPDDSGVWVDDSIGLGLGHRRLSILDLSSAGHQPMHSSNDQYVIVFNGEIYNHLELRAELDNNSNSHAHHRVAGATLKWRGHSDTETLLAGLSIGV